MEPDDFKPRKINAAWTFGPIMWNKDPWDFPPLTDEQANILAQALNDLADQLETHLQLEAMDLLETEVTANDCSQARQMLDDLFNRKA
jgi:hypothetical protein